MKIALTGAIACGKSKILQLFETCGADIISLDEISREVVMPKTQGLQALVKQFGANITNQDDSLNRAALRTILLKSQKNKLIIEAILHPEILEKMQAAIKTCKNKLVVVEIALLAEKNLAHLFDRAIIVQCGEQKQLERLKKRDNFDKTTAKQLINVQISQKQHLEIGKQIPIDVIENNSEVLELTQKVQDLYQKLNAIA